MKRLLIILTILSFLTSCDKDNESPPVPAPSSMMYTNFKDSSIYFDRYANFDLDSNGSIDIYFSTRLVGDPVMIQDKKQWLVGGAFFTNLAVNGEEDMPKLQQDAWIHTAGFSNYHWYNASQLLLTQYVLGMTENFWAGSWKDADHQYFPIQIINGNEVFNGWVEISFNTQEEKLILHRAGLSKQPFVSVKSGR